MVRGLRDWKSMGILSHTGKVLIHPVISLQDHFSKPNRGSRQLALLESRKQTTETTTTENESPLIWFSAHVFVCSLPLIKSNYL